MKTKLRRQVEALEKVVKEVEWVSPDPFSYKACPWCGAGQREGHKPDCKRQAALAAVEEK